LPIAEECATLRCGVAVARTIYTHVRANACKKFDWKNDRGARMLQIAENSTKLREKREKVDTFFTRPITDTLQKQLQ
jgi:hypothetical protein